LDESLLAAWVVACDTHREASEKSAAVGLLVKSPTKGVPIQNPFLPIMNRQALIMMRAVRELGFSPAARRERQGAGDDLPQGKKNQAREAAMKVAAGKFSQAPPPKLVVNNS
jgi:phage terminase small subunit